MADSTSIPDQSNEQLGIVSAVDHLEALFQKTESDLDYVENKLKMEIMNDDQGSVPPGKNFVDHKPTQEDPLKVMEELSTIKNEFGGIAKEFKEVQEQQKEFMDWFKSEMSSLGQMVTQIESHAGVLDSNAGFNEQSQALKQLGIDLEKVAVLKSAEAEDADAVIDKVPPGTGLSSWSKPVRSLSSDCVLVREDEFNSVSPLVRGRCRLDEVNQVYKQLHNLFKSTKRKIPITAPEMTEMGMKVTGATGEAKLKILRALKLVSISSKGVTVDF